MTTISWKRLFLSFSKYNLRKIETAAAMLDEFIFEFLMLQHFLQRKVAFLDDNLGSFFGRLPKN